MPTPEIESLREVRYSSLPKFLTHTFEISQQMQKGPSRHDNLVKIRKLNPVQTLVLAIAPKHKNGVYDKRGIIHEVMAQLGRPVEEFDHTENQVHHALDVLKAKGLIEQSEGYSIPPRKEKAPITEFEQSVLAIAPIYRFAGGRYEFTAIAKSLLKKDGLQLDKENLLTYHRKVDNAMKRLRTMGILRKGGKVKPAKLREPMWDEIEKHTALIDEVYRKGHPYLQHPKWRSWISREEMHDVGRDALARAIAHYDETRGVSFDRYAKIWIAGEASRVIRQKLLAERTARIIDREAKEPSENIAQENMKQKLRTLLHLHQANELQTAHLVIWALRYIHSRSKSQLAKHFGISSAKVEYLERTANQKILQRLALDKAA